MWKRKTILATVVLLTLFGPPIAGLGSAKVYGLDLHNGENPLDVDGNRLIQPRDALLVINLLEHGFITTPLAVSEAQSTLSPASISPFADPGFFYDTNNDTHVTPVDALLVINHLINPVVPEPSSVILGGLGLASLAAYAWRRRRRRLAA